ncbi:unnamed protein product [marine sediment metagenome]|uniref:dATP/dGTP diphosphohydrolase N-terminal domain-containing protein n=1 Tax=marine sediment metagenome TaxID=412755 RepID=X1FEQ5_9ZZZZ
MIERKDYVNLASSSFIGAYYKAREIHAPMQSLHEGYAIIKEEFDELWDEIKRYPNHKNSDVRKEAIQMGAMIIAFLVEAAPVDGHDKSS